MLLSLVLVYTDTKEVLMWIEGSKQAVRSVVPETEHLQEFIKVIMEDNTPVRLASHEPNTPTVNLKHWSDVLTGEATEYQSCLETNERPRIACNTGTCRIPSWARHQESPVYHTVSTSM